MHGPPNFTETWQPIDAGVGAFVHDQMGRQYDTWALEQKASFEDKKISIGQKRILLTHWFSSTMTMLAGKKTLANRAFEKTGCLLTVSGLIEPQGLVDYPNSLNNNHHQKYFPEKSSSKKRKTRRTNTGWLLKTHENS